MKQRIKRLMELEPEEGINEKDMEMKIRAVDRKRRDYYQYYTGNTWGRAQNYHLCVDSSLVGVDGCLRAALAYLEDVCKDEEAGRWRKRNRITEKEKYRNAIKDRE